MAHCDVLVRCVMGQPSRDIKITTTVHIQNTDLRQRRRLKSIAVYFRLWCWWHTQNKTTPSLALPPLFKYTFSLYIYKFTPGVFWTVAMWARLIWLVNYNPLRLFKYLSILDALLLGKMISKSRFNLLVTTFPYIVYSNTLDLNICT